MSRVKKNSMPRTQAKNWVFTLNNYTEEDENRLKEMDCKWMIFGHEEAPETGTKHLQGAVCFDKRKDFNALQKLFKWHLEVMRGSPQESKTYCTKEDPLHYFEKGEMPENGRKKGGKKTQEKWREAIQMAKEERFDEIEQKFPSWWVANINKFKQIAADAKKDKSMDDVNETDIKKHFLWLWGPAGTGKSHTARRISRDLGCEEPYLKDLNKWWNGYNHQKVTIIEEACPKACEYLASYFKKWCDKWNFTAECKGTVIPACRPEYIIVTSNYSIGECFPEENDRLPIERRFTEIALTRRELKVYWPWNQPEYEEMIRERERDESSALGGNTIPPGLESQQEEETPIQSAQEEARSEEIIDIDSPSEDEYLYQMAKKRKIED